MEEGNEAAQAAVDAHFARHPGPDGGGRRRTWATVHAAASLRRHGLDYPRDVSLVAMDGLYAMEESRPDLTRVDLGAPQLADAVVRALINERMDESRTLLLPSFLPGGSTRSLARAPSGGPRRAPNCSSFRRTSSGASVPTALPPASRSTARARCSRSSCCRGCGNRWPAST